MTQTTILESGDRLDELVREAVRRELAPAVDDLRRFLDRRLCEVSAEINATVQFVDSSETNLASRISFLQDQVALVLARPERASPNSGIELEAIVRSSEDAANRILGAAESIRTWLASRLDRDALPPAVKEQFEAIILACAFQDLTGQRVRRAMEHLQRIEDSLATLATKGAAAPLPLPAGMPSAPDLDQTAVDKLFE